MPDSLTIEEHRSSAWKLILYGSLFVTILFVILFLVIHNLLLIGIFRLIAFIGFACLVLAILRLQGTEQRIEIDIDDNQLRIKYFSSIQKNQEELIELETIDRIEKQPAPAIWRFIPRRDCSKLQISFTDTPNILSLLRYKDRDLYINHSDARKAIGFFGQQLPAKIG